MRAETIRRLLVFGVCALGVSALYLVPSLTHAPDRATQRTTRDDTPISRNLPASIATSAAVTTEPVVAENAGTTDVPQETSTPTAVPVESETASAAPSRGTPSAPTPDRDSTPPEPVPTLRLERATEETATISWSRSADDVGVAAYRVWLNGYVVSTTTKTSATVRWFNDDSTQQIVQVRAVDAAGNESQRAASLLTSRPTPSPTGSPTPSATESPSASAEAAPSEAAPSESVVETPR